MTIPVVPGPWSFLQNLGQGVANYGAGKEQFRTTQRQEGQEDRKEAMDKLTFMFQGIQTGDLDAKVVKSPLFMSLLQKSGLGESGFGEATVPNPTATLRQGQNQALGGEVSRINTAGTGEERTALAAGKVLRPSEAAVGREQTARATTRAATIEGGGAAGRLAADVMSPEVAAMAEEAAADPHRYTMATRSVDATLTELKIPEITAGNIDALRESAWQLAQQDARSKGFTLNEQLTRPYIDAAIQQRRLQQELEKNKLALASARGANNTDDFIRIQQRQAEIAANIMKTLPEPSQADFILAGDFQKKLEGLPPDQAAQLQRQDPLGAAAAQKVNFYYTQRGRLSAQIEGTMGETQQALSQNIGVTNANPTGAGNKMTVDQLNAAAQQMTDGKLTEEHIQQFLQAGRISTQDAEQIRALSRRSSQGRGR